METRLQEIIDMIITLDTRAEARFQILNQRMDNLEERIGILERTVSKLVLKVEDLWDSFSDLRDVTSDHGRRLKKLGIRPA